MNILTKLLYLFQVIPINPGKNYFNELSKTTSNFIWQGKKPRIKQTVLQDVKERGGFGLPNWTTYYYASALTWIKEWLTLENERLLILEGHDLTLGWHAYAWYEQFKTHSYFKKHILRKSLLQTWIEIKKYHYMTMPEWVSPIEAIYHPNLITPEKKITYKALLDSHLKIKSRQELEENNIKVDWWMYTQIIDKFNKDKKNFRFSKNKSDFDKILMNKQGKQISNLYKYLIKYKTEGEIVKDNMISWARNIGHTIELEKWEKIWKYNWKMTKATSFKENQYKMLYRWHISPNRLAKMYPKLQSRCWKCKKTKGTFYHMWWTCTKAKIFWNMIDKWLTEITTNKIKRTPELFLLGIFPKNCNKELQYLIIHILVAARITYASLWKNEGIPTEEMTIKKILDCAEMDMMSRRLKGQEDSEYYKVWGMVYKWVEKKEMKSDK